MWFQLSVFLHRTGHYGNAVSPGNVAECAEIGVGSVYNCTHRVMVAILVLHDEYIHAPTEDEKEMLRRYVELQTCISWRNGLLTTDGTKEGLFTRPGLFGDAWFDKSSRYSSAVQESLIPKIFFGPLKLQNRS